MAYGKVRGVTKPLSPLPLRIYALDPKHASEEKAAILTVPIDFTAGDEIGDNLVQPMCADFNKEVYDGRTYPQEDELDVEAYKAYFLSHDLILGLFLTSAQLNQLNPTATSIPPNGLRIRATQAQPQVPSIVLTSSKILALSQIAASTAPTNNPSLITLPLATNPPYAFTYYIKPNYPGRSSHLCNAGFLVAPSLRGQGLGRVAARSFLFYAPGCGYKGSVFNLVYVDNEASVKLWEALGFQRVGRIPGAGRLKARNGESEEFVDAWVVFGDFGAGGIAVKDGDGDGDGDGA